VGGGYGRPLTKKEDKLDGLVKNKESIGDDTLSALSKAFPLVRHNHKGPGSTVGGLKLTGQSPIKKKPPRPDSIDDDELSALSKQLRPFLPKEQMKAIEDFQKKKKEGRVIDDDELSALSKQFRPFLPKTA
jgi:hypothetical protein